MTARWIPEASTFSEHASKLLLMLGGLLVTIYILAPFSWLVLTSFMHEQDALSVPTQWIPVNPTLSNYLTFFDPSARRSF
jgi:multiple sugar transport system permease protein